MGLDLPLDAHLHTDFSSDANVPIDAYAAVARQEGLAELAITDHLDFDPRGSNYRPDDHDRRQRTVREAAERWAGAPLIRFGVELTYESRYEDEIRDYLARHPYDYAIGSVHIPVGHPLGSRDAAAELCAGKDHREVTDWYWAEAEAAPRSGLFDTRGHVDFVKRWVFEYLGPLEYEPHADLYDRVLRALVESGTALEVNSSGLRSPVREVYPPAVVVERFRDLGGVRVTVGSDAHQLQDFGFALDRAYRSIIAAGYRSLLFRRGGPSVAVELSQELAERSSEGGPSDG